MLCGALGLLAFAYSGSAPNVLDIAPRFGGVVFGVMNTWHVAWDRGGGAGRLAGGHHPVLRFRSAACRGRQHCWCGGLHRAGVRRETD